MGIECSKIFEILEEKIDQKQTLILERKITANKILSAYSMFCELTVHCSIAEKLLDLYSSQKISLEFKKKNAYRAPR